jgi:hypothetical protein
MFYVSIIEAPVPRGCWLVNARPGKSVRSGLLGSKRRQWRAVDYFFGHLHMVVSGHPFPGSVLSF